MAPLNASETGSRRSVILFYKYFEPPLEKGDEAVRQLVDWHKEFCGSNGLNLRGRVILAKQGVNGTMSGTPDSIDSYIKKIEACELELSWLLDPLDVQESKQCVQVRHLFESIDWKRSECDLGSVEPEPFPDLVVQQHEEIVPSDGMSYPLDQEGQLMAGTHLSPEDFHARLSAAQPDDNMIVLDVRNRSEYAIGHFVDGAGRTAAHPNMRNFKSFQNFVEERGQELLAGKQVMMYCTGGIRCETASAYLRSTGLAAEVCQLQGGIHRYVEQCGTDSLFKGKNFVFDRRIAIPTPGRDNTSAGAESQEIVGRCSECGAVHDELVASAVCTACICLVLVCPTCREHGVQIRVDAGEPGCEQRRREWFCEEHTWLRDAYFSFLEVFDEATLLRQKAMLQRLATDRGIDLKDTKACDPRQRRRTIARQLKLIDERIKALRKGAPIWDHSRPLPCRVCGKDGCDGHCWGFWKTPDKKTPDKTAQCKLE